MALAYPALAMMRRLSLSVSSILVLAVAGLAGCGGDDGLTVRGSVEVMGDELQTGFPFPSDVRIDGVDTSTSITGTCELRRLAVEDELDHFGVVVEMHRGTVEDRGLASITIMQRTDSLPEDGRVDLTLGTTAFASREGECQIDIDYVTGDGGVVGLSGACDTYDENGAVASAVIGLDLIGCTVSE